MRFLGPVLFLWFVSTATAGPDVSRDAVASWVSEHRGEILEELTGFLALPNVSSDQEAMHRNADHLRSLLERRGMEVQSLESGGAPYLFARLAPQDPAAGDHPPVVLFYCHFDGQPVDPSQWTRTAPFEPMLDGKVQDPDARLYARSASDDKSPIIALLAAVDALRELGLPPSVEAKFFLDPEEEIGSPHLQEVLDRHADLLQADLMIFADGPVHQSGLPTVVFGTRGIVTVTLTVYGPRSPLHSGHYGNWAPNPAWKLARLLTSMKEDDGTVRVAGFYDDVLPLSQIEERALASIPGVEAELQDKLLIARPDGDGKTLQELINLPSLNVRGLSSGWVGSDVRTIIPATATAEIDLRLVRDVEPRAQVERLVAHIREQGFHVVQEEPDAETRRRHPDVVWVRSSGGVPATRSPMDTPISHALVEAVTRAVVEDPVLMPTLGGTGPLYPFQEGLSPPVYGVPIVNPDNNQHAPDENLRLGNLWEGIVIYASLLRFPPPLSD